MDRYVIRVYLENANANKLVNPLPYRIYDNGITVGEMIDEEWTAYERLVIKDQIELRKIIQCEPALDYLNIESYTVDISEKNGILEVSGPRSGSGSPSGSGSGSPSGSPSGSGSGPRSGNSSFFQWSTTTPIPSEVPASLVPIIQSLLVTLEVDNCKENLLDALQQSLPTLQQQKQQHYPLKSHLRQQYGSLNQKQQQQQQPHHQPHQQIQQQLQQHKYQQQQQHKYQQQQQQHKYQQQQLKPKKALQHKSRLPHSYTKKPSTTSLCLIQLDLTS